MSSFLLQKRQLSINIAEDSSGLEESERKEVAFSISDVSQHQAEGLVSCSSSPALCLVNEL